jgi:[calcium/calmodulin-dependent protein kinase] kinase
MKKSVGMSSTFMDDVRREVAIMKKLEHQNVLKLYEVMDDPKVNKMYLVLEYCKRGDLMQMTKGNARTNSCNILPEFQVWEVMRQVLHGLKYLHDNDIVHGDLKPQNLLVDKNGVVKIADFGISKMIETSDGEKEKLLETAGTPAFMSPELCAGLAYDGYLADVYAVGATIFMLRCGHPPFVASKLIALYHKIQEDPVLFTDASVSSGLKNVIEGMMVKDPGQRYTLVRVMQDSWMQIRPGDDTKKTPPAKVKLDIEQNRRVEVSNDEIFMSVHQVAEEAAGGGGDGKDVRGSGGGGMDKDEAERRMKSFKKKASVRQRSFEKLDNLMEGANSANNSDDDYGDDDEEDFVKVSKLDSIEFNSVMDTLAHQSPVTLRKKQAPIPGIVVGRVLDGLPNSKLGIRAAFHSEKGKRPKQEDAVTVIMDLSDLGDSLERPYLYQKFAYFGIYDGHSGSSCSKLLQHRLHTKFSQNPSFFNDQQRAAVEACLATDEEVCSELRAKDDESGSTALFLVIDGRSKKFTVSNVGDCRCVLSRGGTAIDLSKDHRLSRKEVRERVLKSGGIIKSERLNGVLAVTRR